MQRFFVEPGQVDEAAGQILICGDDVNHIRNVLRMREGEELWISAGGEKEYYCSIQSLSPEQIELKIYYISRPDYELPTRLYLFQGIPKGDKMDLIVQKAVELGAYSIIPVEMKRCVVRLDAKKAQKKLGQQFFRVKQADKPAQPGYGLGLSSVMLMAKEMGGSLTFQSEEGVGSTFFINLPAENS